MVCSGLDYRCEKVYPVEGYLETKSTSFHISGNDAI
jgi:hypothetical protein